MVDRRSVLGAGKTRLLIDMFDKAGAMTQVQVPPRPPKKKDMRLHVFLFWYAGPEEGGLHNLVTKGGLNYEYYLAVVGQR